MLHPPPTDALHLEAAQAERGLWLTSAETQELAQHVVLWRDFAAEFAGFGEQFHATLDGFEARQGSGAFDRRSA